VHELNHATGHPTRMNRDLSGKFGSNSYACEEMAAVFVCNALNLPMDFHNHAAYVAGWLKKVRQDKRELLSCAADADRIAEYTLAYHPEFSAKAPQHQPVPV
jgi:antirestriction protein ArdC